MLIVDKQKMSAQEFCDLFGIDLPKVRKQPSFAMDKSLIFKDAANGGIPKVNKGSSIRTAFWTEHPIKKVPVEVIYAEGERNETVGGVLVTKYEPRYTNIEGEKFSFQENLDKALWLYLRPSNAFSPLRKTERQKKIPATYAFIDTAMETKAKLSNLSNLSRALAHAENLDAFELIILAKGLQFRNVDTMEIEDLRADVMTFAANPATTRKYLDAVDSNLIKTEGRIQNLVDKGIIKLRQIGQVRQWYWEEGERAGQTIGDQILSNTMDAVQALKVYILSNMEHFDSALSDYNATLGARIKAEKHFNKPSAEKEVIPSYLPGADDLGEEEPEERVGLQLEVTDFNSAKAYIHERGYKRNPAQIKLFYEAVNDGEVNHENVGAYLRELFAE